ncbi:MAG: phosphatase PAP2 family protein [Eubacteriales bacterium]|nr:phosphatase PAP2 family protein [Eubacteriales bacterium]
MFKRIMQLDELVLRKVKKLHSKTNNRIMAFVTHLGTGGFIWFALSLPLLIIKSTRMAGVNIMFSLVITYLLGELFIKHIVARIRPSETLPEEEQIVKRPKYYSFPSGHSASSFSVVAVTVFLCRPFIFIPVIVVATMIAFSRLYLRVHYLSDVVVGVLLGFACGAFSVPLFKFLVDKIGVSF